MKRAFLIHCWEGTPEKGWYPWLKDNLDKRGFEVTVPSMPDTETPKMDAWLKHLANVVGEPDKECYFVGHSLGCITILRYLETFEEGQEIGGAVLVAGFSDNLGFNELDTFFTKPLDWEVIKSRCRGFIAIHSDNDPYVPLKHGDIFKEELVAEVIIKHGMKHFSGHEGVTELPVALESVLKLSK